VHTPTTARGQGGVLNYLLVTAALGASGAEYDPDQVRVQDLDPVLVKAG
jgi:hypothetical protein